MTTNSPVRTSDGTGNSIYDQIRAAIIALQFAPGQLLSENELASRYEASRTPVRDALKRLEREGLVRISSRRKTMVAPLDLGAYRQAVFARDTLESAAAREAARLFFRTGSTQLSDNVDKQLEALQREDVASFDRLDFEFHWKILEMSELEQLAPITDTLRGLTDRMRVAHLAVLIRYDRFGVADQHRRIADAIEAQDCDAAASEMSAHVVSVFTRITELAKQHPEFFGGVPEDELAKLEDYVVSRLPSLSA